MKTLINTPINFPKSLVAAGFLAIGCVAIGANALALEPTAAATAKWSENYRVAYSDLDVSTMKGAKTLYLRIRFAAETLCASAATWGKQQREACVNKAVGDAVVRVDRPLLSQYHQLRTQGDGAGLVQLAKTN